METNFRQQLFRPPISELFSSVPKFLLGTEVAAALEHRLSVDSQTTVICNQPCPPPLFRIQPVRGTAVSRMVSGTLCLAYESRL